MFFVIITLGIGQSSKSGCLCYYRCCFCTMVSRSIIMTI